MASEDDEEEIGIEELAQRYLMMGLPEDAPPVVEEFCKFVRRGCNEEQATNWLRKHRDEFPDNLRKTIDEIIHRTRYEEQVLDIVTRYEAKKRAAATGKRDSDELPRSEAEFMKRCEELHREGGVALQLPYMLKYGNLFR